jgi:hypothetical protein
VKKLFDMKRVEETATFISAELVKLFDRNNIDSHMGRHIAACPTYNKGLTNGERLLATLRALSMAQLEISSDLGSLTHEQSDFFDDDDD